MPEAPHEGYEAGGRPGLPQERVLQQVKRRVTVLRVSDQHALNEALQARRHLVEENRRENLTLTRLIQ